MPHEREGAPSTELSVLSMVFWIVKIPPTRICFATLLELPMISWILQTPPQLELLERPQRLELLEVSLLL